MVKSVAKNGGPITGGDEELALVICDLEQGAAQEKF
jgi:hypothetical protein